MRRRTFIAAVASTTVAGALPAAASTTPPTLRLPPPTGPHRTGTTTLHLVDSTRRDPWNNAPTRELMVTIYYPASTTRGYQRAPHLSPTAAAVFGSLDAGVLHPELPSTGVDWAATRTHATSTAP
ncbi:hypothetical protein [Kribbella italica]|uniref:Uncharacterized protein n=1 Tax=Kribbella italica TaxID=1540520 RepID=A0A7W9J8M5_9ACTN|nr:hypothetical protein [Kribbella italica]MBB5836908.1 hypothetical protein [Kribbella italica]